MGENMRYMCVCVCALVVYLLRILHPICIYEQINFQEIETAYFSYAAQWH